jgi:Concanavalin A-like lectin/glucanases superfamily
MRGRFVNAFVVLTVAVAALPVNAQIITDVDCRNSRAMDGPVSTQLSWELLADGAAAFIDRAHVYRNVPEPLVGAEYILMVNDDKTNPDLELHVTVAQAATLYLIIDNRIGTGLQSAAASPDLAAAEMTWVAELGFEETDMKMALDENANGHVNNYYTLFSKSVLPGVIVFKGQYDTSIGNPWDRNMYGVAAVAPRQATDPVPADSGQAGIRPLLEWTPGVTAAFHNVYLGTNPRLGQSNLVAAYLETPSYRPSQELTVGAKYYWRVDEVEADMMTVETGNVWSFVVAQSEQVGDPTLVGWWTFEDVDSGVATDSSGAGHHGILLGNPRRVDGYSGRGVQFDGVDDYIETGYAENLPRWTVCVWGNSPVAPAGGFGSGPVHREANYQLNWNHGNSQFRGAAGVRIGDSWHAASFGELFADTWYHLAATFDGTSLNAYVDGVLITSNPEAQGVPFFEPGTLTFGKHARGEYFFAGTIDDVRLYSRALVENEISDIVHVGQHLVAWDPGPAYGAAVDIREPILLSWSPADDAVMYDVYFGTDEDAVAVSDIGSPSFVVRQAETSLPLVEPLEFGTQYFWRVDAVAADGATIHQGPVWTFSVADYLIVDEFESYTGDEGNRIYERWLDGDTNTTGAVVSNPAVPLAEPTLIHGGKRSMSLSYDNMTFPFYSETQLELPLPEDWTLHDVDTLSLWFRGDPASFAELSPGTFAMNAAGADIWSNVDEFRYVYKQLTGDGVIVARLDTILEVNAWGKAGVMIRESLAPGSIHGFMCLTPDGRRAFQNRLDNGSGFCYSAHSSPGAITLPHWVKLEREGDLFTAYHSPDGINWILQPDTEDPVSYLSPNPRTIYMPDTVHIGLALTSHAGSVATSAIFSGVEVTGAVSDQWQSADIGRDHPINCPDSLYVTMENSDGKAATLVHPDTEAVNATAWTEWKIPLSDLGRMRLDQITSLSIGIGSRRTPIRNGFGRIYIDDIRLLKAEPSP